MLGANPNPHETRKANSMIKIHEYQYVEDDPSSYQERDTEYKSWNKYVEDIISQHGETNTHSLPKNTYVDKIYEMTEKKLVVSFYHFVIGRRIRHIATLMEDSNEK